MAKLNTCPRDGSHLLTAACICPFHRAALGKAVDLRDISRFDPSLGASLDKLHRALHDWRAAGSKGPLLVDGVALSDLCLTFTLPGHHSYPLAPEAADAEVDESNLEQYIQVGALAL
jgi:E3 ubiquitin-protein ligase TRIP12